MNEDYSYCLYRNNAVFCNDYTKCKKCGWNPKVEEKRIKQFRENGVVNLQLTKQTQKPKPGKAYSDSYCANYIETHDRAFGGDMPYRTVREILAISEERYKRIKKEIMEVNYGVGSV